MLAPLVDLATGEPISLLEGRIRFALGIAEGGGWVVLPIGLSGFGGGLAGAADDISRGAVGSLGRGAGSYGDDIARAAGGFVDDVGRGAAGAGDDVAKVGSGGAANGGMSPGPVYSGHGGYNPANGTITVPDGTAITVYTEHGGEITDALGNAIETGRIVTLKEFGPQIYGARTYLPGAKMPNYTLAPPGNLNIMGNPFTASEPINLSSLLSTNMGNVHWAACLYIPK